MYLSHVHSSEDNKETSYVESERNETSYHANAQTADTHSPLTFQQFSQVKNSPFISISCDFFFLLFLVSKRGDRWLRHSHRVGDTDTCNFFSKRHYISSRHSVQVVLTFLLLVSKLASRLFSHSSIMTLCVKLFLFSKYICSLID